MNLIELLKGVWRKMVGPKTIENVLHITPLISNDMKNAIELWEKMYKDKSPWLTESIKSLGLASLIASEKARTATIEMDIKITGDGERAKFMKDNFQKVVCSIREQLEYGVALGGFVIKPYVVLGVDGKYIMEFNYTRADNFYPLSYSPEGKVTEAAFIDKIVTKDAVYSKVEYHKLVGTDLQIFNYAFKASVENGFVPNGSMENELGNPIPLTSIPAWASITPQVNISNMDTLLFAYFKMPEANTIDLNSPLGASGYGRAVDLIKEADQLYSDLLWEFEGSQLAIDVDVTALNLIKDANGKEHQVLPKLQERLYRHSLDLGDDNLYNVFSPNIRDKNIINGLNNQLMRIEDACFISRGTLSVVSTSEARTATELKILKQRSYAANQDIQKALQKTFEEIFVIMGKYCDLYDIVPSGNFEVAYKWDDSILIDKDAERQQDLLEVNAGLMSKLEYRMKWYGETEEQAKQSLEVIDSEAEAKMQMAQKYVVQPNTQSSGAKTDAQKSADKNQRASESNEVTEKSKQ